MKWAEGGDDSVLDKDNGRYKPTVIELMGALYSRLQSLIDLRYSGFGEEGHRWVVMAARGNGMVVVHDTWGSTPEESLAKALCRWDNRSVENPF